MRILLSMILTVGIAATAFGGSYTIDLIQKIDPIDGTVSIDPVTDEAGQLESFVFSVGSRLMRYYAASEELETIQLPHYPCQTIHRWQGEMLRIYVAQVDHGPWQEPATVATFLWDDSAVSFEESAELLSDDASYYETECSLHFARSQDPSQGVILTANFHYFYDWFLPGWWYGVFSASRSMSSTLSPLSVDFGCTDLMAADILPSNGLELVGCHNPRDTYARWEGPDDIREDHEYRTDFLVASTPGDTLFFSRTESGSSRAIFAEDFFPEYDYDEVIYYAYAEDIKGLHGNKHEHVACYNFLSGAPYEIWHQPLSNVSLDYVYHPGRLIAGRRSDSAAFFLDYTTGLIVDSVYLDRHLANIRFFETSNGLCLTGRVYDTVIVYNFQLPVDAPSDIAQIPDGYSLSQNFPNPFNPSTTIEFALPHRSAAKVNVYNVLGQRVVTLVDGNLAAGNHSVVWAGVDQDGKAVVSGVYFYRIVTDGFTATKKMILLQ